MVRPRWATPGAVPAAMMLALVVAMELRWIRGALVRDCAGPAIVATVIALVGSSLLSRTRCGWPRVPLGTWVTAWLRFLGLAAAGSALGAALFVALFAALRGTVPWTHGGALLRFLLLGVAGAALLAALGRLVARPPEPPPITSPDAR